MDILKIGADARQAKILYSKGIYTVEDLLNIEPKDYGDFRQLKMIKECNDGQVEAIVAKLAKIDDYNANMSVSASFVDDNGDWIKVTWFQMPYIRRSLYRGEKYVICGEVKFNEYNDKIYKNIVNPLFIDTDLDAFKKIVPFYPKIDGISNASFLELMRKALEQYDGVEVFPEWLLNQRKIIDTKTKYKFLHLPETMEQVNLAKRRISFDDIFQFAYEIEEVNKVGNKDSGFILDKSDYFDKILESLPFTLTEGQQEAVLNIISKTREGKRVNALVQGDVGAGKTIVAVLLCFMGVNAGYQAALMAPTGVLARQHYEDVCKYAEMLGVKVAFLAGSTMEVNFEYDSKEIAKRMVEQRQIENEALLNNLGSKCANLFETEIKYLFKENKEVFIDSLKENRDLSDIDKLISYCISKNTGHNLEELHDLSLLKSSIEKHRNKRKFSRTKDKIFMYLIESGEVDIVVGTHSVISERVKFKNLAITICDEEHRFGVLQKDALVEKAKEGVHHLSMTATPIPRSLALTIHGEGTDVYTIRTMPSGRKPVITILAKDARESFNFMEKEILNGRQCYVICPLTEESNSQKMKGIADVKQVYDYLVNLFTPKGIKVGMSTGKMEKEDMDIELMKFKNGEYDILIATTIVEVGVNVPNSTVITILNAERFGLAQLHQLRGRVGRGSYQSYCYLISENSTKEALIAMTETTDGFKISEKDMELRGTGEFIGVKQSGENKKLELAIACPKALQIVRGLLKDVLLYGNYKQYMTQKKKNRDIEIEDIKERIIKDKEKTKSKKQ